ncbi:LOW QUALITY PROTEIN: cytochrome c oxidase assembly protein COX16 homolog, mitochondrial [Heterodontus francisci]|uniref:LOW QUALITY PROTEIN: cytochrome c oxidase assembly protein COX16 homolog, mitochondrial n=1 Tax=Heterodontus francisci TaxID=7792 RepID=UPI00355C915D
MSLLSRSKTLKYGLPMLLLIVGGSFGLREFAQVRYDVQKVKRKIDPALESQLSKNKNKITMESEYQKLQDRNLDDWVNIRGPRPWEDSKTLQDQQRKTQNANNTSINMKH